MLLNYPANDFRVIADIFEYGDSDWLAKCEEVMDWCRENITGKISVVPGEIPGQVCYIFDNADAAFWFRMRWIK